MYISRKTFLVMCGTIIFPCYSLGKLVRTPWQSEGPFYPDILPEDTDNDLVKNGESTIEAGGKILNLNGSLINRDSIPIQGLNVEIWQTDVNGVYLHSGSFARKKRDLEFQGFGRTKTDRYGRFFFRTILPTEYPGRTPHIHVKFLDKGKNVLSTQLYIKGHPLNKKDFLFQRMSLVEREINSMTIFPSPKKGLADYETNVGIVI